MALKIDNKKTRKKGLLFFFHFEHQPIKKLENRRVYRHSNSIKYQERALSSNKICNSCLFISHNLVVLYNGN